MEPNNAPARPSSVVSAVAVRLVIGPGRGRGLGASGRASAPGCRDPCWRCCCASSRYRFIRLTSPSVHRVPPRASVAWTAHAIGRQGPPLCRPTSRALVAAEPVVNVAKCGGRAGRCDAEGRGFLAPGAFVMPGSGRRSGPYVRVAVISAASACPSARWSAAALGPPALASGPVPPAGSPPIGTDQISRCAGTNQRAR
jgi:hypothetical protein